MKKLYGGLFLLLAVLLIGMTARTGSTPLVETDYHNVSVDAAKFVGATKCRTCHRKPETGEQYPIWEASAHANAFNTLGTDEAKAIAAEKGIDNPQTSTECLECHVTGYNADAAMLDTKYDKAEGVTCESCHGAGSDYVKKSTMTAITKGEIDGATVGLVTPDEALCITCHNERSPSFEGFDFAERSAEIAHPIPEERKAAL